MANSTVVSPQAIAHQTIRGAAALGIRQVLVQGLNILGGILLARLLSPAEFGLYAIVTFLMSFLVSFGGTGLAANLIRQLDEPGEADYGAVFTIQQALVLMLAVSMWFLAPMMAGLYHLPKDDVWLFRCVGLSLLFTSFMVVPQVRLERHLEFDKLALIEVGQAMVFNGTAVLLAWKGWGVMSFAVALLSRSLTGAVLANWVRPWRIVWLWDWPRAKSHLRFGICFQGAQVVSVIKDSITPVLVGLLLGPAQVGYINWAGMVATYPVLALMVLQRVYMPAFARMQADREQLSRFVEGVIWATNALTAPLAILTLVLINQLTRLIFGEKWLAALPLFYLLWAGNLFVPTATPLIGLLNALGNSRTALGFAVVWMLGTWVMGVPLILAYGTVGFALANLAVQFTNFLLYRVAQQQVHFKAIRVIWPVWAAGLGMGMILWIMQEFWPVTKLSILAMYCLVGIAVYFIGLSLLCPSRVRWFTKLGRSG
jgi:O-antigen/teichoic acid export membrane protein